MKREKAKLIVIVKYLLLFILAILTLYLVITTYKLKTKDYPHKNTLEVSPLSGKSIATINSSDMIYNIEYDSTNIFDLYRIYDNEIVYEIFDSKNELLRYKASSIKDIGSHEGVRYLDSQDANEFPDLNFWDYTKIEGYEFNSDNADVFLEYSENVSNGFIYSSGQYKYINTITQDSIHHDTGYSLTFSNVFVQFLDEKNPNSGDGILFSGGKAHEILWTGKIFLFKQNNSLMTLNKGNTIWIPLNSKNRDKVIYNK